ncbi:PepSY-associated TM helix domain-containing protein [Dyella sp.]|uniref:PepSY-associated TM helix domain-containing protein n=1 Tax=Dyella sp. TaxID=1869338 RepID=UPI002ED32F0F
MTSARSLKRWYAVHKWSSLICTVFLLLICLTGLPLVFHEEIDNWLQPHEYEALPADTPTASLERFTVLAHGLYPHEVIASIFVDTDEPQVFIWMAPSFAALKADPSVMHPIRADARTAKLIDAGKVSGRSKTFIDTMLALHSDLFIGLPGELFLGLMAVLFVVALVSGVVLYGPFMKKLDFGTVRRGRANRLKWLDLHNLLGIVTLAWALVVGVTGVLNELSTPLFGIWQQTDVKQMLSAYEGQAKAPAQADLPSVQMAMETARHAVPGMRIDSVVFPGNPFGSPYHYLFWAHGDRTLTSRLFSPVLVDARSGQLSDVVRMPWYLRALEVSRPLHFGDYGGLPLKILWALLDLITIIVLCSGLYLWVARRHTQSARLAQLAAAHEAIAAARVSA